MSATSSETSAPVGEGMSREVTPLQAGITIGIALVICVGVLIALVFFGKKSQRAQASGPVEMPAVVHEQGSDTTEGEVPSQIKGAVVRTHDDNLREEQLHNSLQNARNGAQ